jgi:polyisoprenoid-binding protein YceI
MRYTILFVLAALGIAGQVVRTVPFQPVLAAPAPAPAGAQRFVIVPGDSSVTYRVQETHFFVGGDRLTTAVGVTTVVRGEMFIDRVKPANSRIETITVDISQFRSNSTIRDNVIRNLFLQSARFPMAEFTPTTIQGLPDAYQDGREVDVQITGNLKIRDVTRPTPFASTVNLEGNTLIVSGSTMIKMTDFGFNPPFFVAFGAVENDVRLEFRFIARPP